MAGNLIKIFLSSPGDVPEERLRMAELTAEINDVLAYIVPERRLKLELLRYEVDAYPDYGAPQDVVNRLIPDDFDIFVGIMWKRCGTPTGDANSGTIEEYQRAVERRKSTGKPVIMFYLCNAPVAFPSSQDVEQLKKVVREELQSKGLTQSYPSPEQFRAYVRGDLLKAIRDLTSTVHALAAEVPTQPQIAPTTPAEKAAMRELCEEYDTARRDMPGGQARTSKMTEIFAKMRSLAASTRSSYPEFKAGPSAGVRLAAVAILQMFSNTSELDWLAQRLDPEQEKPFVGYQAAQALLQAARSLPASDCPNIIRAVTSALELANRNPDDPPRILVLKEAQDYLNRKCAKPDATGNPQMNP
jgi:hypothetical protein